MFSFAVLWPSGLREPNSSSGVSVQQNVGSSLGRDTYDFDNFKDQSSHFGVSQHLHK